MFITDIDASNTSRERSGKFQASPWPCSRQPTPRIPGTDLLAVDLEIGQAQHRSKAVSAARRILAGFA